jgi:hypothetical protein
MKLRLSLLKAAFARDPMSAAIILAYILAMRDEPLRPLNVPSNSGYDSPCCGICDDCGSILRDRTA